MQSVLLIQCFICKVSFLSSAAYAKSPSYVRLGPCMQPKTKVDLLDEKNRIGAANAARASVTLKRRDPPFRRISLLL